MLHPFLTERCGYLRSGDGIPSKALSSLVNAGFTLTGLLLDTKADEVWMVEGFIVLVSHTGESGRNSMMKP